MPCLKARAKASWGIGNRERGERKAKGASQGTGGSVSGEGNESKAMRSQARGSSKRGGSNEMVSRWIQQGHALRMQEMEEAFRFFDENKDGEITVTELASALERLGDKATEEQVSAMMEEADTNRDGVISFEEFLALQCEVGRIHRQEGTIFRQDAKQAFSMFDEDGNGLISAEELQGVLGRLGWPCTIADSSRMISRVDLDGDAHINFEEFFCMISE